MATYKYTAKDINSKITHGKKEANSRAELVDFLRSQDLYLLQCRELVEKDTTYKFKLNELSDFSRQIGTMLGSGISLIRAMSILVKRDNKPKITAVYKDIYVKLQQGLTLSSAMEMQGNAFPTLMISMYRSGESSGQMETIAKKMAIQYEKEHKLKNKLKSAMTYPMILICVTIAVVIIIFTFVISISYC